MKKGLKNHPVLWIQGQGCTGCSVSLLNSVEPTIANILLKVIIALGTCASYGGIPAAKGSVTGAKGVTEIFKQYGIKTPTINLPGCPMHPDWVVGSILHLLEKGVPELDADGRPVLFYGENIHENCPHLDELDNDIMAKTLSDPKGCRMDQGCAGPNTSADCFKRKWNSGLNWCVDNSICIGCVEPGFPDASSPFYVAK